MTRAPLRLVHIAREESHTQKAATHRSVGYEFASRGGQSATRSDVYNTSLRGRQQSDKYRAPRLRAERLLNSHETCNSAKREPQPRQDAGAAQTCPYRAQRETTYTNIAILQREALEVQRAVDVEK